MKQLELRYYPREEIADICGTDAKSQNFKRNTDNVLQKWGYGRNYGKKSFTIISQPQTAKERLSEIMIRKYNMDIQTNCYEFASFLYSLLLDDAFASMPWKEREDWLRVEFNICVDEKTLRNWCSKFIQHGTIVKDKSKKTYWRTNYNKTREEVFIDDKERQDYWNDFWNMRKNGEQDISKTLWNKYGCCYYSCASLMVSAFDDISELEEIIELVNEVAEAEPTETIVETTTKLIDVPVKMEEKTLAARVNDILVTSHKKDEFVF